MGRFTHFRVGTFVAAGDGAAYTEYFLCIGKIIVWRAFSQNQDRQHNHQEQADADYTNILDEIFHNPPPPRIITVLRKDDECIRDNHPLL